MKVLAALALAVGAGGLTAWAHGGPREAWAVVRLDRWHAMPFLPPDWSTCYAPSFTHGAFLASQPGDAASSVRATLGEPLTITWFGELAIGAPSITFVRSGGQWVVGSASGVDAPPRAPMASLEGRRTLPNEYWSYSQSCTSEESVRIRGLTLRDGRVVRRNASVIYD
jgi:hypothetical protein